MKFTIKKSDAVNQLSKISGIVESRSSIPILSNVHVTASKDNISLCVTDNEISATVNFHADVNATGETTIPASKFFDMCRKASGDEVDVSVEDEKATIKSGKSKFTLSCLAAEHFPLPQLSPSKNGFSVDAGFLLKLLDDTSGSMSDEETRHYLRGVYLHEKEGKMLSVSTDGHRLSSSEGDAETKFPSVIIPAKTVSVLQKILADYEGDVFFEIKQNKIQAVIGNLTLTSKVVDGTFPDYERIIPKQYTGKFTIDTDEAVKSIERICTVDDKTNKTRITASGKTVVFERASSEETALDEIDAEYSGVNFMIGVDSTYLLSALKRIKTGRTVVQFGTPETPILLSAENDDTASWLVMPMRI